jgi:hypothetical protein
MRANAIFFDAQDRNAGVVAEAFRTAQERARAIGDEATGKRLRLAQDQWFTRTLARQLTDPDAIALAAQFSADNFDVGAEFNDAFADAVGAPEADVILDVAESSGYLDAARAAQDRFLDSVDNVVDETGDTIRTGLHEGGQTARDVSDDITSIPDETGDDAVMVAAIAGTALVLLGAMFTFSR